MTIYRPRHGGEPLRARGEFLVYARVGEGGTRIKFLF